MNLHVQAAILSGIEIWWIMEEYAVLWWMVCVAKSLKFPITICYLTASIKPSIDYYHIQGDFPFSYELATRLRKKYINRVVSRSKWQVKSWTQIEMELNCKLVIYVSIALLVGFTTVLSLPIGKRQAQPTADQPITVHKLLLPPLIEITENSDSLYWLWSEAVVLTDENLLTTEVRTCVIYRLSLYACV